MKRFTGGQTQERNELTTIYDRLRKRSWRKNVAGRAWIAWTGTEIKHESYMRGVRDALYAVAGLEGDDE